MQVCFHAETRHEAMPTTMASLIFMATNQNVLRVRPNTSAVWHIVRAED